MNVIFFASAFRRGHTVDPTTAADLGQFVGGYFGALFALVSVLLLFSTLKAQRRVSQLESFEGRYFELLRLHRDNVEEMQLKGTRGRRVFVLMLRELREIMRVVRWAAAEGRQRLTSDQIMHVAYYCLFYGTGPNSRRMLKQALGLFDSAFVSHLDEILSDKAFRVDVRRRCGFDFTPFEGHQSRLGHYYRHLYQTVSFVHSKQFVNRYEYARTIRAQLSTHEQALLLINSRTPLGQNWWTKGFIVRYRMVQNIPRGFLRRDEVDCDSLFEPGYFEWEEAMAGRTAAV